MNYHKEIMGNRWLEPAQFEAKKRKDDEAFKVRLAGLPVAEAKAVCLRLLAIEGVAATSSGQIAAEYLKTA